MRPPVITPSDLIRLRYTPDLTEAGILYACRSLAFTYDRMGGTPAKRLRRIVSGKAVELAFRRWLVAQRVAHDTLGSTPFTDPDRYDIAIGGRRVDLKSYQLFRRDQIRQVHRQHGLLLDASAMVPQDQVEAGHLDDDDLYIFSFLTALVTAGPADLEQALAAGQPVDWLFPCPEAWSRPANWASLGPLALKLESGQPLEVELGGQAENHGFQTETVSLPPKKRRLARQDFCSLAFLRLRQRPAGRVGIHSPILDETLLVQPEQWDNIWVYGMRIYLAGYITRGEFRRRAQLLPQGSRVWQYNHTRTPNYALPLSDLHPLHDLLTRARHWNRTQD